MDKLSKEEVKQSRASVLCYLTGVALLIFAIILGELLWLPATITTASGMQWIEMIDWVLYGLIIIPLLLATGALLRINRQRRMTKAAIGLVIENHTKASRLLGWLLQLLRAAIIVVSLIAVLTIAVSNDSFIRMAVLLSVTVILAYADLVISESDVWRPFALGGSHPAGYSGSGLRLKFPKRSAAAVLGTAILITLLLCPTGYLVTYPGMTLNMNRYAHVEGGSSEGEINGVLVFDRPAFIADWLYGKLFALYEFEPTPENEPPLSETYAQVVAMKNDADSVAAAIAMQKAGVGEGVIVEGARIVAVLKDAVAVDVLQAGDVIVQMNDRPVYTIDDMISYMEEEVKPGMDVGMKLIRNGELISVIAPTGASAPVNEGESERAVFGVSVQTATRLDIPLDIDYSHYIAHVGGPSHGAMLTLAIIDQLTPGGVTGEFRVAGTGTIESDGSIGLVGGVPQKAYAVSRTKADVFFVPAALEQAARSGAPNLNIVPVETIDDILTWLERHR